MSNTKGAAVAAWLLAAVYYFFQYSLRSAPAVMMPQLSGAFALDALGAAALAGLFYYGYSPFSLIAGAALDRFGPRAVLPAAAALTGAGALLFASGTLPLAQLGRFLQGAGGVFSLVGAVYIASRNFPASRAGTLIGATQMFGMAGGSAGQFVVGPLIAGGLAWSTFWAGMGTAGIALGVLLFLLLPRSEEPPSAASSHNWLKTSLSAMGQVFRNPQSILCGLVAGLLFIPTTIFDMVWGVRFLQDAHSMQYSTAVLRSAAVPFGWIIGCPLLGMISDRIGRRKPVILGGALVLLATLAYILFGAPGVFPPYSLALVAGIASGAAMLPYTVIKEANPPQFSGTATGVINFVNFTFSALLGPVFGRIFRNVASGSAQPELVHYQAAFEPLLYGVAIAILLIFFLKETGPRARPSA